MYWVKIGITFKFMPNFDVLASLFWPKMLKVI